MFAGREKGMVIKMDNAVEAVTQEESKKWGATGSTLKMIAIITMIVDHTAAIVLERVLWAHNFSSVTIYWVYVVMRSIGRLGFPIFCFLLIEGFCHTRNVKKYAGRLFLFALISEMPFDLGFSGKLFYMQYQNVFFTLLIGLLVLIFFRYIGEKKEWNSSLCFIINCVALVGGMCLADFLRTDYGGMGVLTIVWMYLLRKNKMLEAGAGCAVLTLMSWSEVTSFLILLPIHRYNGERGWNLKWIFYLFYPAHIFLLYIVAYGMGLGGIMLR